MTTRSLKWIFTLGKSELFPDAADAVRLGVRHQSLRGSDGQQRLHPITHPAVNPERRGVPQQSGCPIVQRGRTWIGPGTY